MRSVSSVADRRVAKVFTMVGTSWRASEREATERTANTTSLAHSVGLGSEVGSGAAAAAPSVEASSSLEEIDRAQNSSSWACWVPTGRSGLVTAGVEDPKPAVTRGRPSVEDDTSKNWATGGAEAAATTVAGDTVAGEGPHHG